MANFLSNPLFHQQTYVARSVIRKAFDTGSVKDGAISIRKLSEIAYSFAGCDWSADRMAEIQKVIEQLAGE